MDKISSTLKNRFFLENIIVFISIVAIIVLLVKIFKFNAVVVSIFMVIGFIMFNYKRKTYVSNLENIISKDKLTVFYNYNYFNEKLNNYLNKEDLNNKTLSIMFIDINYFKMYNDVNGHLSGEIVLKELSEILSSIKTKNHIVTRYSGDEFALILKNTTKEEALVISKEIKNKFNEKNFSSKIF